MTTDGGGVAAFGYRYQYLVTAEEVLRILASGIVDLDSVVLIVEPTRADLKSGSDADNDVVDFAIEINGQVTQRVQVKSSRVPSKLNPLKYSDVSSIFKRMGSGSEEATVLTNKPLAKKLEKSCSSPFLTSDGKRQYLVTAQAITNGQPSPRRSILHDDRQLAEIKQSILDLIREIRGDHALGRGLNSAGLLAALLMDSIFEAAADVAPRRRTAREISELICMPDAQIAHALRRFDWGSPLIEVPRLISAVARTAELAELTELFTDSVDSRNPKVAVLVGVTGFGKSTLAADFCHLNRHFYEHVLWVDCRTESLIEAKFKDVITQLGIDPATITDVASTFRTEFARMGGPSIIVFDGARRRQDIERFLPTSGCGFTIVTTTNSTGWWHTSNELQIASFTPDEATACFEAYAGIEHGTHTAAITDIVNRLGRVPLAIAMAALHFRNADEDISQLSREYFAGLNALDDHASVPEGFDRTAFAAVTHAVAQLGTGVGNSDRDRKQTQGLIYHAAFLAPELIPLNLLLQTVKEEARIDLTDPPAPEVADQGQRNKVLVNLRTQTIATRRSYIDPVGVSNPASDTISIHPLVHEILRSIYRQQAPLEQTLKLLTMLMACAYGWIIKLRREGTAFPLEQLLIHGQWILDLVDSIPLPDNADAHKIYVFRCAKMYLACEIANCAASKGEFERSVAMIERALDEIEDVELTPHAQGMVTKAGCDMLSDIDLGHLGTERARLLAPRALRELRKFSSTDNPQLGDVIASIALQAGTSLKRLDSPDLDEIALEFLNIAASQQVSTMPTIGTVAKIHRLLTGGQYRDALALIRRDRRPDANVYDRIMFDNFESIASLHLGNFNQAADSIDRILTAAGTGSHLRPHLSLASEETGKALLDTEPSWSGRSTRLSAQQIRLQQLHASLTE
jgi:hypothetical protein